VAGVINEPGQRAITIEFWQDARQIFHQFLSFVWGQTQYRRFDFLCRTHLMRTTIVVAQSKSLCAPESESV